jgi:hypothetical protein
LVFAATGSVFGADTDAPLVGATVADSAATPTTTDAVGAFSLQLPWGLQRLTVSAAGYLSQSRELNVTGPLSGLAFVLPRSGVLVSGTVTNGLAGTPIAGATFITGTTVIAVSGANGTYRGYLSNGSYAVTLRPNATASPGLPAVTFVASIAGIPTVRNFTLFPPASDFSLALIDAASHVPLLGGSVNITGRTDVGTAWSSATGTGSTGTVTLPLYPGNYTFTARAPGYSPETVSVQVGGTPVTSVVLPLASTATPSSVSVTPWIELIGGVIAVGVVGVLALALLSRRRSPAYDSAAPGSTEEEAVDADLFPSDEPPLGDEGEPEALDETK